MEGKLMRQLFLTIGVLLGVLANVTSIGYGLYLWGGEGVAFGLALWTAFKLWISIVLTALLAIIFGLFFKEN